MTLHVVDCIQIGPAMRSNSSLPRVGLALLLRRHALLIALILCYSSFAAWMTFRFGVSMHERKLAGLFERFAVQVPMMVVLLLSWRLVHLTYIQRDPDRIGTLKAEVKAFLSDRDRMISGLFATVLMTLCLVAFAQMKNLIPRIQPFAWDQYFTDLDQWLHFGWHPYELAHAVFGSSAGITAFGGLYNLWLFMMYFVLFSTCFMRPDSLLRMRYLVAFVLTWSFGGNLVATIFSSAGPVYYSILGIGDTFAGLTNILHAHAETGWITVVRSHAALWYLHTQPEPVNAISAFPSMHVASSVLMAIFLYQRAVWLGRLATVFAAAIMVGSVLLAWHYAVDGYAGAVIAVFGWIVAGWLVRLIYGIEEA